MSNKLTQAVNDLSGKKQAIERLTYLKNLLVDLENRSNVEFTVKDTTILITQENFPEGYAQFISLIQQYIIEEINGNGIS